MIAATLAAALVALAPAPAAAQPNKPGDQPLKTPPAPGKPGAPAQPGGPAAAPGGAPGGQGDPTAILQGGIPEIKFAPKNAGALVSFNLDDADLPELVKAISNITGRRFIYGGKLRQMKASVYAPEKVMVAEAYAAFLSILQTNGLTVIPHGRFLKIIESGGVVSQTTPVSGTATPVPDEDRYLTRLYRVSNVNAQDVANILGKFKTKDGDITVYDPTGLLILTDTGSNIRRMLRIVEELDAGSAGDQIWLQPIHNTPAEELAAQLNELLELGGGAGGKGGGGRARIVADPRNNSLFIVTGEEDYQRVLELIKRIDVPDAGEGGIHVLPLQHAQCDELAKTLNEIMGGKTGAARASAGKASAAAASAQGSVEAVFEGQVTVTCDLATNSLVTTSTLRDYAQLRNVVDQLDQPRRQVFIEAVIMDVNVDHSIDLGVGYHAGATAELGGSGPTVFYGGTNPQQSLLGVPANLEALAFGVRGPDLEGSSNLLGTGLSIPGFGVVLHALAKSGDSNVLATPHILATDNIPAEISIGQNIPLQTNVGGGLSSLAGLAGQAGGAAGGLGALGALGGLGGLGGFSAPRQDVGIKLKVVPHINDSDQVRMELTEEFSDAGSPVGALGAVPINKRTANTTIVVRDRQTVVIGGLVRESQIDGATKVPILGDIPVLGILFRQTQKKTQKTNLLLILTPHIVRDQSDLRRIFEQKMQQRQEFIDRYTMFDDTLPWEPPPDYRRANGLLEQIRQTQLREKERFRLAAELAPKTNRRHEPVEPIELPSIAAPSSGPTTSAAAPAAAPKAATPRRPRTPTNRVRVPGGAAATGGRNVE